MPTLSTALRNAKANQLSTLLGSGAKIVVKDGATAVVTFALADPAFGAASNGVATLAGVPLSANASAASVDNATPLTAEFQTSGDAVILTCSVGVTGGGEEILLNTTTDTNGHPAIANGQPLQVTAFTYSQPAS
jgi:hypothetical protein